MKYMYVTPQLQEVEEGWFKFEYKNSVVVVDIKTNRVHVSESGAIVKDCLPSIPNAISWINSYGQRD